MYILRIEFGTPAYDEAVGLRYEVLRRPLGLQYTPEQLAAEFDQIHLAAYSDAGSILGYLNLTPLDEEIVKMRQVAVSEVFQSKGVGTELVRHSEQLAREMGFRRITLHAREKAVQFYLKLGYAVIGDRFEEVSIPHFKMGKEIG